MTKIKLPVAEFPTLISSAMPRARIGVFIKILRWAGLNFGRFENIFSLVIIFLLLWVLFIFSKHIFYYAAGALLISVFFILAKSSRAKKRCAEEIPDALDALVRALRAGYSFQQAIALVSRESRPPVKNFFEVLRKSNEYGLPLKQAVEIIDSQADLFEWRVVGEALLVYEKAGGNIIPVFSEISQMIRNKLVLQKEIKSNTAAGKMSGIIIAAMFPLSLTLFNVFNPEYISILTDTVLGKLILAGAAALEMIGFLIIWRITNVDI